MPDVPWAGLVALLAMFVIPFLPEWLFEGPRTIKHRPRRHVCGDCGAPWTDGHICACETRLAAYPPLQGELHRPQQSNGTPRSLTVARRIIARSKGPMRITEE
jgi:hypothetical protein